MILVGLTGSIGMGKSTAATMFRDEGVSVWDADEAVGRLYGPDAAGTRALSGLCPDAVGRNGVDRTILRGAILKDKSLLSRIEAAVHPLVSADRKRFIDRAAARGERIVLCDIPLLFESNADRWLDVVIVVSAPAEVQKRRVLDRPGMTEKAFKAILDKQTPDAEKRRRADHVIDASRGLDHARAQVRRILETLETLEISKKPENPDA